jgi:hypothetical protein
MEHIANWLTANESILAVLVTVGIAVLVVCGLECTKCGRKDDDDLFHHHEF